MTCIETALPYVECLFLKIRHRSCSVRFRTWKVVVVILSGLVLRHGYKIAEIKLKRSLLVMCD
jgi:hypothetical protein